MVRTPSYDKSGLKKGTWTPEEDRKLMAYVTRYGCWNWRQLPKYAGLSRCGKSCRLRWMNYLRPNIKRGNYAKEEEDTILKLHASLGNRWSVIAAHLPGRTDNEIKNHWHTNLKKRIQKGSACQKPKPKSNDQHKTTQVSNHDTKPTILDYPTINPQTEESSTLSPNPSSASGISSDDSITVTSSSTSEIKSWDDNEFAFLENFWTEPFLADNHYMATELLTPAMDDPFSALLDSQILCPDIALNELLLGEWN